MSRDVTCRASMYSFWKISMLFLCVLICMYGCRSKKKIVDVAATETTKTDETTRTGETLFYTSCYPIETISIPTCKFDVNLNNRSLTLNGNIYVDADSVCFFRGRFLVEVVRGAIYRDSFVVVNIIDRTCFMGKNDYLEKITGYPVNPQSIMRLLTADKCEDTYRKINPLFRVEYGSFNKYPQWELPTIVNISASDGINSIRIRANFQQILFDTKEQMNINIPSSYKVIVLQ